MERIMKNIGLALVAFGFFAAVFFCFGIIEKDCEKLKNYETEAAAEECADGIVVTSEMAVFECETVHFDVVAGTAPTEPETEVEETTVMPTEMVIDVPEYFVEGVEFPYAEYLYNALNDRGIAWWMPYAVCQAYQESRFDTFAENPNGLDKGLFQFRTTYWEGGDIFNPYFQIEHYANMVKARINEGKDVYTIISDHYTGEAWYDAQYVSDVLQWMEFLEVNE